MGDMDVSVLLGFAVRTGLIWLCGMVFSISVIGEDRPWAIVADPTNGLPDTRLVLPARKTRPAGLRRDTTDFRRADTMLRRLHGEYRQHLVAGSRHSFRPGNSHIVYRDGRVMIEAVARHDGAALERELLRLGLTEMARYGLHVAGMLPVSNLRSAASLASLRSISAAYPPVRATGAVTSQGDVALRADIARAMNAVAGTGVTLAVMSDSYDQSILLPATTAADDIASGDLPPGDPVVPGGAFENCISGLFGTPCTDEGRAMLQLAYDLAPGASLLFHTALNNSVRFASGINTLVAAGADVIVDDLAYPHEPMFMDGIIAQAVDAAAAAGVSYFSAAGNAGRRSYETGFVDSGEELCLDIDLNGMCDPIFELAGPMHDFDPGPGVDTLMSITVPFLETIIIGMQWQDPFGNVETGDGPRRDHDIFVLTEDGSGFFEDGLSAADNVLNGSPVEVLVFTNIGGGSSFSLAVTYDAVDSLEPPSDFLKLVVFGSNNVSVNEFLTNSSTIVGHANAAGATAVGAAFYGDTPEFGQAPPLLEPYSSAGGTPILFDTSGDPLGFPVVREKPDITAVDGVSNTFFGSPDVNGDGFPDFFGTSAAAPHAAAVAALVLEANPALSPANVNALLRTTAIDMDAGGFDFESGYGLIQADAAVGAALAVESCAAGPQAIPAGQWHAFSMPCNASPDEAVTDVFPGLDPAAYGSDWEVLRHDAATQTDVPLAAGDPIGASTGYWILSNTATTIGVDGFVYAAADIPLVADSGPGRLNHLGVPHGAAVPWADVMVVDGAMILTLGQADPLDGGTLECEQKPVGPNCRMSRLMHKWNGSAYESFDGVTPGMEGTLSPFDGFVVRAFKPGIELRIPPPARASRQPEGGVDGWQVRLIAESGARQDAGNVLGQLSTAGDGLDSHDLEELAPFGDSHLSILFTNPAFPLVEWGYTSDFHAPTIKPTGEWPFVVRASDDVGEVTLRWEGDEAQLNVGWLIDLETGERVRTAPGASYTYTDGPEDREFVFAIYQR